MAAPFLLISIRLGWCCWPSFPVCWLWVDVTQLQTLGLLFSGADMMNPEWDAALEEARGTVLPLPFLHAGTPAWRTPLSLHMRWPLVISSQASSHAALKGFCKTLHELYQLCDQG